MSEEQGQGRERGRLLRYAMVVVTIVISVLVFGLLYWIPMAATGGIGDFSAAIKGGLITFVCLVVLSGIIYFIYMRAIPEE